MNKCYTIGEIMTTQIRALELLKSGSITQIKAAEMMNLSTRQVRRKMKKYLISGTDSLRHLSTGKTRPIILKEEIVSTVVRLASSKTPCS